MNKKSFAKVVVSTLIGTALLTGCAGSMAKMYVKAGGASDYASKYQPIPTSGKEYQKFIDKDITPIVEKTVSDEKATFYFKMYDNKETLATFRIEKGYEGFLDAIKTGTALFEPVYMFSESGNVVVDKETTKTMYNAIKEVNSNILDIKYTWAYAKLLEKHIQDTKQANLQAFAQEQIDRYNVQKTNILTILVGEKTEYKQSNSIYNETYFNNVIKALGAKVDYVVMNNADIMDSSIAISSAKRLEIMMKTFLESPRAPKEGRAKQAMMISQRMMGDAMLEGEIRTLENKELYIRSGKDLALMPVDVFKKLDKAGWNFRKININVLSIPRTKSKIDKQWENADRSSISISAISNAYKVSGQRGTKEYRDSLISKYNAVKKAVNKRLNEVSKDKNNRFTSKVIDFYKDSLNHFKITVGMKDDSIE